MSNTQKTKKSPQGKMVEIDGILYMFIDGKLYRYANLTLDKGFKITLGRPGSEEVLKHMLNRLLGLRIKWLEYRNTEHPGMTEDDRSSRFDVYCEDEDGNGFQVEMQDWWMYSLKNMFNMTECPSQILGTEVEDLFTQSELARMTLEQRLKIEESIMTENDIRNSIAEQLEEGRAANIAEGKAAGLAEGRAEGRAEGELAKAREIAAKLLEKGLSRAEIAAIVGIEESALFIL